MAQGRTTVSKRRSQTPKVLNKVLVTEHTLGHFQRSSREPDFRVPCSICQHAVGLSLSYDIVREHGGGIIPESRHGEYTEMTVILPHTKKANADYDVGKIDS